MIVRHLGIGMGTPAIDDLMQFDEVCELFGVDPLRTASIAIDPKITAASPPFGSRNFERIDPPDLPTVTINGRYERLLTQEEYDKLIERGVL